MKIWHLETDSTVSHQVLLGPCIHFEEKLAFAEVAGFSA